MTCGSKRILVISGASRGLGACLVSQAVDAGFFIIGCSRGEATFHEATRYRHFQCDITEERSAAKMFHAISKEYGTVFGLINNAGVLREALTPLCPAKFYDECYRTNVFGTFIMSREAAKSMRSTDGGRIVNVSSTRVPLANAGGGAYIASKAAVEGMTRVMAAEFAAKNITVNAVGPGLVSAGMSEHVGGGTEGVEKTLRILRQSRLVSPVDVWGSIAFLLSDAARSITGQIIYINGNPDHA